MSSVGNILIYIIWYLFGGGLFILFDEAACRLSYGKTAGKNWNLLIFVVGGIMAILCIRKYGYHPAALICFALLGVLAMISRIDFRIMEIPNRLNLAVFLLGMISALATDEIGWQSRLLGFFIVSLPMMVLSLLTDGGFGGGDIKLMAASGVFLGWKLNLTAALAGFFLGGLYGAWLLIVKKAGRKEHFAFGPFLCAGIAITLLIGDAGTLVYS